MKVEKIETPRLYLRGFTREDARFAIGIWNDREMGEDEECCYLIAEDRGTGERIGTCSFIPMENGGIYDIAYCVHKSHWRQGYATEMIKGMVEYARRHGAKKITVTVDKKNTASNGVMKKLGFTVAAEGSYKKRGTDRECSDYKYELLT